MTWTAHIEERDSGRLLRVTLSRNGQAATFGEVVHGWTSDAACRAVFLRTLADAPQAAFLWETPPLATATLDRSFECALIDSPALAAVAPDPHSFAGHFGTAEADAETVTFANLGGDALLVAPTPRGPHDAYPHLAAFCRAAPGDQQHAFWRAVGAAAAGRVSDRPLWLSTNGLGVAWLHARLDSRPKYYAHRPYRSAPPSP